MGTGGGQRTRGQEGKNKKRHSEKPQIAPFQSRRRRLTGRPMDLSTGLRGTVQAPPAHLRSPSQRPFRPQIPIKGSPIDRESERGGRAGPGEQAEAAVHEAVLSCPSRRPPPPPPPYRSLAHRSGILEELAGAHSPA
ncbi:hypothetical protein BO71DRAFT_407518 [Aspergillus ellipticus CBS 707.79]|uniref:Uncharacterized protein n=1 Tax=Aspergillus ellipticus CBS 707.79 TaxID=1448320 RepID=A0A319DHA0_9EURO|nr:hypothetical protein BO71DRAFT_407518 [Aspergillus ellipticus CBS 707.79]